MPTPERASTWRAVGFGRRRRRLSPIVGAPRCWTASALVLGALVLAHGLLSWSVGAQTPVVESADFPVTDTNGQPLTLSDGTVCKVTITSRSFFSEEELKSDGLTAADVRPNLRKNVNRVFGELKAAFDGSDHMRQKVRNACSIWGGTVVIDLVKGDTQVQTAQVETTSAADGVTTLMTNAISLDLGDIDAIPAHLSLEAGQATTVASVATTYLKRILAHEFDHLLDGPTGRAHKDPPLDGVQTGKPVDDESDVLEDLRLDLFREAYGGTDANGHTILRFVSVDGNVLFDFTAFAEARAKTEAGTQRSSERTGEAPQPPGGPRFMGLDTLPDKPCGVAGGGGCYSPPSAADRDLDGVHDDVDNCPWIPNAGQLDANGNGIGDHCERTISSWGHMGALFSDTARGAQVPFVQPLDGGVFLHSDATRTARPDGRYQLMILILEALVTSTSSRGAARPSAWNEGALFGLQRPVSLRPPGEGSRDSRQTRGAAQVSKSPATLHLTSLGLSLGEAFQVEIRAGEQPVLLEPDVVVVEPLSEAESRRLGQERSGMPRASAATGTANAYCLEFLREPPLKGQVYRIAGSEAQQRFARVRRILNASQRLQKSGALKPDSEPLGYFHSIRQWAIWTTEQRFNRQSFEDAMVEHANKSVRAAGQQWTKDIETLVRRFAPNRWSDIQQILREAGGGLVPRQ